MTSLRRFMIAMSLALFCEISLSLAAEAIVDPASGAPASVPAVGGGVDMFAAMQSGDLDVKFIPKNDREARVILKNNTKKPLSVKLPEAFAGVPVLAQAPGGRRGGGGAGGNNMMNQGMGGGMGGMGMGGMGGMGGGGMGGMGGGGMFNIPPEQVRQFKVDTVCLDHGKKDPRPAIPYEIHPIESYTTKTGVAELCAMLGRGKIDQRAAQIAAWHLNSGMSWDDLSAKRVEHLSGESEPYFSAEQMQQGLAVSNAAEAMAAESPVARAKSAEPASGAAASAAATKSTGKSAGAEQAPAAPPVTATNPPRGRPACRAVGSR